jgi:DNA-binding transcriptional regulator YdaS (Cro superfamily)
LNDVCALGAQTLLARLLTLLRSRCAQRGARAQQLSNQGCVGIESGAPASARVCAAKAVPQLRRHDVRDAV